MSYKTYSHFYEDSGFYWTWYERKYALATMNTSVWPPKGHPVLVTRKNGEKTIQKVGKILEKSKGRTVFEDLGRYDKVKCKRNGIVGFIEGEY